MSLLGCPEAKDMPVTPELFTRGLQDSPHPCGLRRGPEQERQQCWQSQPSEQALQDARKPAALAGPIYLGYPMSLKASKVSGSVSLEIDAQAGAIAWCSLPRELCCRLSLP